MVFYTLFRLKWCNVTTAAQLLHMSISQQNIIRCRPIHSAVYIDYCSNLCSAADFSDKILTTICCLVCRGRHMWSEFSVSSCSICGAKATQQTLYLKVQIQDVYSQTSCHVIVSIIDLSCASLISIVFTTATKHYL